MDGMYGKKIPIFIFFISLLFPADFIHVHVCEGEAAKIWMACMAKKFPACLVCRRGLCYIGGVVFST